jgi:septal ring factor EnvC (AmiA/AmiB activator)
MKGATEMSALPTLIIQAETSATAVKAAADQFVTWLNNVRNDIPRCEEELAQKRRVADTEIAKLRASIDERKRELASAEQELRQVRRDLERERKEIGMEKQRLFKSLDEVLAQ